MDITGWIVNLISGAVGGNVAGYAWKEKSLGSIGNTIAGAVGGVAGNYILQAVGFLSSAGLADMTAGSLATSAGVTAVLGAAATAVVGYIKAKMNK